MPDIEVNLRLLIDILTKKNEVMNEIYNISINQESIISSGHMDMALLGETADLIKSKTEMVNTLDEHFQKTYDLISKELSENIEQYKTHIAAMKEKIQNATELKIRIKLQEESNSQKLSKILA